MSNVIMVKMADFNIAQSPDALATSGIGSCVAICLYDKMKKIGGLAHVMLPLNKENNKSLSGRYADTAIAELTRLMVQNGAAANAIVAKITGGARVMPALRPVISVGDNNIEAVKKTLAEHEIPLVAENTGGTSGRSCIFFLENGSLEVTILTNSSKILI